MARQRAAFFSIFLLFLFFSQGVIAPNSHQQKENMEKIQIKNTVEKFYGYANSDIYVVGVSSPYKIYIDDFSYSVWGNISGKDYASCSGAVIINKTRRIIYGGPGGEYHAKNWAINYFHFKIGSFNYTYDNRPIRNYTLQGNLDWVRWKDFVLPPGRWYFIFFICWEDNKHLYEDTMIKAWINFSEKCNEISISTSSEGKIYNWWYGEFESNFILFHFPLFSAMLNGRINFHINNTLVYSFMPYPDSKGIMKILWKYPDGREERNLILNLHGITIGESKLQGIGGKGDYELSVSYWDRASLEWRNVVIGSRWIFTNPIGFIAIDVKLPDFGLKKIC